MDTTNYIPNFSAQIKVATQQNVEYISNEKYAKWIYRHSTLVKTLEVAGIILGLAAIASAPFTFPLIGAAALAIAAAGTLIAVISYLALTKLHLLYPTSHSMQNHIFKPASYGAGRLYYQGDIPILELKSDNPYKAGEAHGYLLGSHLNRILKRLDTANASSFNPYPLPRPAEIPRVLKALRQQIPQEYLSEMQGVVDGFNKWASEGLLKRARKIALDDLLLVHLLPESLHFQSCQQESLEPLRSAPKVAPALGCTVAIDKDEKEGFVFGRNLDWPTLDIFGASTLVINRHYAGSRQATVEVGMPGLIGTLTGMNKQGLSLAMNICEGTSAEIKGMPTLFYNRYLLENCRSVPDVSAKIGERSPLGCYHLTVADAKEAKSFHFFQGEKVGSERERTCHALMERARASLCHELPLQIYGCDGRTLQF